jgi:sterol desaturase/sphingolipid hydroxylase (fatty acid hydroxylase superfamily)
MTHASREELRAELIGRIPPSYSPWIHLAVPTVSGLAIAALALSRIESLAAWQLLVVPLFLAFGNAIEWHVHRGVLHRRVRWLEVVYTRHTPQHHMVFVADDMALRDLRELKLVLLPAWALLAIVVLTSPIAVVLAWLGQPNLALLWIATVVVYVLSYEWLHLAYHLPEESPIGRSRAIARLRRHHQLHHATHLMQRWNFNVTLPLWDHIRGTVYRPRAIPARPTAVRRAT